MLFYSPINYLMICLWNLKCSNHANTTLTTNFKWTAYVEFPLPMPVLAYIKPTQSQSNDCESQEKHFPSDGGRSVGGIIVSLLSSHRDPPFTRSKIFAKVNANSAIHQLVIERILATRLHLTSGWVGAGQLRENRLRWENCCTLWVICLGVDEWGDLSVYLHISSHLCLSWVYEQHAVWSWVF